MSLSCSSYFDRLRRKAREIDDGTDRLGETWKTTFLLIGGYADCDAETIAYLEELWETVRGTNNKVEKFHSELESSLEKTDEFLEDSKAIYDDLKEQCDNLYVVLTEYGYQYEEEGDSPRDNNRNDSKDQTDKNLLNSEEMSDVEIEFTPNLTWKCKTKSKRSDISDENQRSSAVKSIATPVIKSLASVLQSETPSTKGSLVGSISIQNSNYSKYLSALSTPRK